VEEEEEEDVGQGGAGRSGRVAGRRATGGLSIDALSDLCRGRLRQWLTRVELPFAYMDSKLSNHEDGLSR